MSPGVVLGIDPQKIEAMLQNDRFLDPTVYNTDSWLEILRGKNMKSQHIK